MHEPLELTRHHALPRRYLGRDLLSGREGRGYTAWDLFKFYGLVAALLFGLAYTYTRYLELFTQVAQPDATPGFKLFVVLFTGLPLLLAAGAVLGFLWWAAGALVQYSRWQERHDPRMWRWFWLAVLLFYTIIFIDPLDTIHPALSRKGIAPGLNLLALIEGRVEWHPYQWGYALLWALFWFLLAVAHYSYLVDGLKELWFYTRRVHRYSASVLTGFRATLNAARQPPVTLPYPFERDALPEGFRGAPRLVVDSLTPEQAGAVVAADRSRSIALAPGQTMALLVDLGSWSYSPQLAALTDESGSPLLSFDGSWPAPTASRGELIVPLARQPDVPQAGSEPECPATPLAAEESPA